MTMEGLAGVQLHLIDSVDDAAEFMRWLSRPRDVLAVDTETDGLDWTRHKVRLIQVGDVNDGWAMAWDLWGGVALEAIQRHDGPIVMHNAKFDTHMLDRWCQLPIPRHRIDDTMVMAHILDSTRPVALKNLTTRLIDPKAAAAQRTLDEAMVNNGWGWDTVPLDFYWYWAYGALDTVLTARLWHMLRPQVLAEVPKAYDLEMARTWVVQAQERRGCQIDVAYTQEKYAAFAQYVEESAEWCKQQYGVSPGTNAAVIERLERDGVQVPIKYTNGGARSLDKEVLEFVIATNQHPLAQVVLQRRRLQKLASTYLANFLSMADGDGVLHPNVRVLGARTSRESITDPPLQTLPRKSDANPPAIVVRNCITGRTESNTLVMCDFDQIEMRMFAHFSRDIGMIGAFAAGDFFVNIARELYADPNLIKGDPRRQFTKNGMYALGYGAGAEKIALTTGQALQIVQEFLANLGYRFPGIKTFQREVQAVALQRAASEGVAYVRSPLTNRKHIADEGKEYALVNYLVQGTAAEVFKLKTIEMAAAGLDEFMVLGVHDEVVLDVPNELVPDVEPVVKSIMEDAELFAVPLTAGIDKAYRWGEKGG